MTDNKYVLLEISKDENMENIQKKIVCGQNAEKKLKSLILALEVNSKKIKNDIERRFAKQKRLLDKIEAKLLNKLDVSVHSQINKVEQEIEKLQKTLAILYSCQNQLEKENSKSFYQSVLDDYESCLVLPQYEFYAKDDLLESTIKSFGTLTLNEVLLFNLDSLEDDNAEICMKTLCQSPSEIEEHEQIHSTDDSFEVVDNSDHLSMDTYSSSSIVAFLDDCHSINMKETVDDICKDVSVNKSLKNCSDNHLSDNYKVPKDKIGLIDTMIFSNILKNNYEEEKNQKHEVESPSLLLAKKLAKYYEIFKKEYNQQIPEKCELSECSDSYTISNNKKNQNFKNVLLNKSIESDKSDQPKETISNDYIRSFMERVKIILKESNEISLDEKLSNVEIS